MSNHDNPRFLNKHNYDHTRLKSALAFVFYGKGIPYFYYGDEQGFAGGADPNCREPLWNNFNTGSDLYQYVATLVKTRKDHKVWESPYVERYVANNFFAFSRGDVLIATTNQNSGYIEYSVTYNPYSEGQTVCNVLVKGDCVKIEGGALKVDLNNGEAKVFVPGSPSESEME